MIFGSARYGKEVTTEGARASNERSCTGGAVEGGEGGMRECERCGGWVSRSNYAMHLRGAAGDRVERGVEDSGGSVIRRQRKACEVC